MKLIEVKGETFWIKGLFKKRFYQIAPGNCIVELKRINVPKKAIK